MHYRLCTLMVLMAVAPPVLAWIAWPALDAIINPPSKLEFNLGEVAPGDMEDMIGAPIILTLEP